MPGESASPLPATGQPEEIHPADGERPGLSQICAAYYPKVLSYATRLVGRAEAEDVAQQVFIKVGRSLETLAHPEKLGSWIHRIALNTIRDMLRKRSSSGDRRVVTRGFAGIEGESESAVACIPDTVSRNAEETAIRNEMVTCYLGYVRQLPPRYYEVYALREFEDLSNDEVAQRLRLPVTTVKIRLHRARARLYEKLRQNCRCYYNERGELMGEPKDTGG